MTHSLQHTYEVQKPTGESFTTTVAATAERYARDGCLVQATSVPIESESDQ